jgi:hypothetical protein
MQYYEDPEKLLRDKNRLRSQILFWEPSLITDFNDRQRWSRSVFISTASANGMVFGIGAQLYNIWKFQKDSSYRERLRTWMIINAGISMIFLVANYK